MGILKDVTQTVKNIFNADDDVMFDDEVEFADSNQQNMFSIPKPFAKKTNDGLKNPASNKMQAFDLSNHGFEAAKNNQTRARSNGKIQVYVPKSFEEAFNIIKDVKAGFTAMVNVEIANPQISQRIVDVISGAIYALDGECKKMGEKQYIFSLSAETIGAYDYLPVNGVQGMQQVPSGFNFNQGYIPNQAFNPGQGFQPNQGIDFMNQSGNNFGQNNYQQNNNFQQNAQKMSQDLQNFYVQPKSQF